MDDDFSFPSLVREQYGNCNLTLPYESSWYCQRTLHCPMVNAMHTGQWLTGISEIVEFSNAQEQHMPHHRYTHMETRTHTQRTRTQPQLSLHRCPQTSGYPQQSPHSGVIPDTGPDGHVSSSSWAGRGRRSLVQYTHHIPQLHRHTHL